MLLVGLLFLNALIIVSKGVIIQYFHKLDVRFRHYMSLLSLKCMLVK